MDYLDPYLLHEPRAGRFILENFPKPLDKVTTEPPALKYKSLIKTIFRTGFNYEDNEPEKEKEKNFEDLGDLNIINNDGESIIDNNSLLSTQKREPTDEEIKKIRVILLENGSSIMKDEDKRGKIMSKIDNVNRFLETNIIDEDDNVNVFDEDEVTKRNIYKETEKFTEYENKDKNKTYENDINKAIQLSLYSNNKNNNVESENNNNNNNNNYKKKICTKEFSFL
jgi:hypothetical protein